MSDYIMMGNVKVPVPRITKLDRQTMYQLKGRRTNKSLGGFVFSLLQQNEITFRSLLGEYLDSKEARKVLKSGSHESAWKSLADKLGAQLSGIPFSDPQIEGAIRLEFGDYPSVIEALDKGTYRIAEFRSRYRRDDLVRGAGARYATFAYEKGMPVDRTGGHSRPLSLDEFLETCKLCPEDRANKLQF